MEGWKYLSGWKVLYSRSKIVVEDDEASLAGTRVITRLKALFVGV